MAKSLVQCRCVQLRALGSRTIRLAFAVEGHAWKMPCTIFRRNARTSCLPVLTWSIAESASSADLLVKAKCGFSWPFCSHASLTQISATSTSTVKMIGSFTLSWRAQNFCSTSQSACSSNSGLACESDSGPLGASTSS